MLESLSNKFAGFQRCNFVKKRPQYKMSSYEHCKTFTNTFSTEHLQTTASLVKVHRIISFRIMSKIAANRKDKGLTRKELCHRYLPWKLTRFLKVILYGVFEKFITADKEIFSVSNKIISITSTDAFIVISGDIFLVLDLKSEAFSGISFRKVSGFCYKLNRKLL